MNQTFIAHTEPPQEPSQSAWWFAFLGSKLLIRQEGTLATIPCSPNLSELGLTPIRKQYLGTLAGQDCYSVELGQDSVLPHGMSFENLRKLYEYLEADLFSLAGRAFQIVEWDRTHQFCGHCGTQTVQVSGKRAKKCPKCGLVNYPRLSPAVIVLVERGSEILLARAHHFPKNLYSTLAGFVEPGESLEDAIVREIYEEVRIEIKDIKYFGSQPWPYPNSLMLGFTATYANGKIQIDPDEIADAAWFTKENLPLIPPKPSIARSLIDWFLTKK
ncbi:MAG: NAD(+) diphosphatase [Chroococcidiopsidaceae cyanobacterium CP_BM_ER_R8_30]|nr:NAD(+) diphosphatase [Chroococcidiopsidaceae cyanobacterium CP_BM_ER_R8_30]